MITCPNCKKLLEDGSKFCVHCGARLAENQSETTTSTEENHVAVLKPRSAALVAKKKRRRRRRRIKKAIKIGCIALAVAVVAFFIYLLQGNKDKSAASNSVLYLKDGEVYYVDLKKNRDPYQLTSKLCTTYDTEECYKLTCRFYTSEDGKYVFYPDKTNEEEKGINLYWQKLTGANAEKTKIDSDVMIYTVNGDTTLVTYLKGDDRDLYQYKMKNGDKEKIASNVSEYFVSDDGKKIVYVNTDNTVYLKQAGKDREKIAGDVQDVVYVSEDFKTVYYVRDYALYKQAVGEDKLKIDSDIGGVVNVYESGEAYYIKFPKKSLIDYIEDDLYQADAALTEPVYPEFPDAPDWWDDEAYDAWQEECKRLKNEYYAASDAYEQKEKRDTMRIELAKFTVLTGILYYYDGEESTVITDSYLPYSLFDFGDVENFEEAVWEAWNYGGFEGDCCSTTPVISFVNSNMDAFEPMKLSEIEDSYDVDNIEDDMYSIAEEILELLHYNTAQVCVAVKGASAQAETKVTNFTVETKINSTGTAVYYEDNRHYDESIENSVVLGDLYRISITDGNIGEAELYESDVNEFILSTENDGCLYTKKGKSFCHEDYQDGKTSYHYYTESDMYFNKVKIESEVNHILGEDSNLYYFTNYDADKLSATLKLYDGKETKTIMDDVYVDFYHGVEITDGGVCYICDYSINLSKGDLYLWKNGENSKIDEDITGVLITPSGKYRGLYSEVSDIS